MITFDLTESIYTQQHGRVFVVAVFLQVVNTWSLLLIVSIATCTYSLFAAIRLID
jgi:hypothetical protein